MMIARLANHFDARRNAISVKPRFYEILDPNGSAAGHNPHYKEPIRDAGPGLLMKPNIKLV